MELLKKKTKRKKDNDINNNKINEIIIIYKIEGKDEIKLFGEEFIENNKNNCKIIIENKEQNLVSYLKVNKNQEILKIKLKIINTNNITNMSHMFCYCSSLSSLPDISKWITNNVTNMSCMFNNCSSLSSLPDISKWNISNIQRKRYMFDGCKEILMIPFKFIP